MAFTSFIGRLVVGPARNASNVLENLLYNYTLLDAIKNRNYDQIRVALDQGENPDDVDAQGNNALHLAVQALKCRPELFKSILEKTSEEGRNATNNKNATPLMIAVACQNVMFVTELINSGVDLNIRIMENKDKATGTALHLAVCQGNVEIIKLLLKGGIDTALKNKEGETAEEYADSLVDREKSMTAIKEFTNSTDLLRMKF